MSFLLHISLGLLIGAAGTLVGAGGGFILIPILIFFYPAMPPEVITAISLAVIAANAASGSIAYARMGRINYRAGIWFALAGLPGSILGVFALAYVSSSTYRVIFGSFLLAVAIYLFSKPKKNFPKADEMPQKYNLALGIGFSFAIGFLSSILGIGGGLIHVPVMIYLLGFPVHFATATSHFVLAAITSASTLTHILKGHLAGYWILTIGIIIGVIPGAQAGAYLSTKLTGLWIVRALAIALALAAARIILMH